MDRDDGRGARAVRPAAACGSSGATGTTGSSGGHRGAITLYSGQHPQTTQALVAAFEQADRHHGQDPQRRRGHAGPADRPGGLALPGRRLLHRELAAARGPRRRRGCSRRSTPRRSPTVPAKYSSPAGDWVGVSARVSAAWSTTPTQLKPTSCRPRCSTSPTRSGRASSPSRRPRPTSSRSSPRSPRAKGKAAAEQVARGGQGATRASHIYPDNETLVGEVNKGQVAARRHQPLLLVPPAPRRRARPRCTRPCPTSRPAIPAT